MNPPYSSALIVKWMARIAEHGVGTALIFARTETATFHKYVWERADALLFFRGRLTFCTVDGKPGPGNGGAPSVLCAYGPEDAEILRKCGLPGQFIPLRGGKA